MLHYTGGFDDLGQKHLSGAEQIADHVHAGHQRAFDDIERTVGGQARLFDVRANEIRNTVHQRVGKALFDRPFAPGDVQGFDLAFLSAKLVRNCEQTIGRIGAAIEHHILAHLAQFRREIVIDGHLSCIDDAHVHPGSDGVIEKHRMHRLAHLFIAAEREGEIGHAARHVGARQIGPDPTRRLDIGDAVVAVLLDTSGDREDVGIEDNVLRLKAHRAGEDVVGAPADRSLASEGVRLALLVERHDHHGGAVSAHDPGVADELLLAFLERDRIDDGLALQAFEARLHNLEFR